MEPDECEPSRGRQARTTRARVGRSGPLFTSSSGSSDGEGNSAAIRPAGNIKFPPNLLGHYYVRDSMCGTSTTMELPITETQHVPITILPSPGSASKRPSSLTPSSVTTARNQDLDLGAASPVGSSHHQQHRYQVQATASPALSSAHSSASRRLPPPPGYVSNSCYQLGCSPQCPYDAPSRRRTTSPRSYAVTYSPEPSPRCSTASVPYKYYKYPRHSCDPGLSTAVGAGQWQTPPRGGRNPLGSSGEVETAQQLRQHLQQLLHQQQPPLREQEPCGPPRPAGLNGLGPPPRPYHQPHRSPAPLPSGRPKAGDAALTDWAATPATQHSGPVRRRARSAGSGLPSSASGGLDGDRPYIPLPAMPSDPPATEHGAHCPDHQPCLERVCADGAMYDSFGPTAVVVAAPHIGNALGGSPARNAGAFLPAHVSPRTFPTAGSIPYQQQTRSPRQGLQHDSRLDLLTSPLRLVSDPQRGSLSELDNIAGAVGGGVSSAFVSDHGGGGGDGVGTRMGSRTGLYDITTILRQDGLVETVLHINTGVSRSPRSLSPSPLANARTDSPQHHQGGSSGGGSGKSPVLTRPRVFPASIGEAGNFLAAPCSLMSELATAAGVPVGASASRRANSAAPHDSGWGSVAATTAATGAMVVSPDLIRLPVCDDSGLQVAGEQQSEDQLPLSWREVYQEEHSLQGQEDLKLFEETAPAERQRLNDPGSPIYSQNPLFRSYGGAIIDPDPMMPNIDSVSPARLTDDGGPTSSGTRTPQSSTRRPMLLLGGPRASSSGGGASSSCVAVEAAPDVAAEGAAAASLGNSAATEEGGAEEDPFSLPLPSPANLRLMHSNSDANSSSSSGRLSPSRLLSTAASEGGPSSSGSGAGRSAFSCSPTRHRPSANGMRVLDLTCLQQPHCDHRHPPAAGAAAEPMAILDADDAAPEALLSSLLVGPDPADEALHELPSLSPCLAGGILDCTWEPLPESVLLTASVATDMAPQSYLPAPGIGLLPPATLDDDEPIPELPIGVRCPYEQPLREPRSSGGSVDSEATATGEPHLSLVPVPIILAAATEVQMQGAEMMALALQMDRKSEDIMAAALDARQRSGDMLAAAEEARVQSFTLIAEAVTVKIHCADMLVAARIVQQQGADLMVVAARGHEVEEEEVLLQASVEREEAGEQEQDVAVRKVEAPAVAPAADAVPERAEQQAADADVPFVVNEASAGTCHGSETAPPPLLSLSSSGDVPATTWLWPPLETNIASRMATAQDDDPLLDVRPAVPAPPFHLGVGAAAAAYLSFPDELTLDVSPAPSPYPDDCEKARSPHANSVVVSHDSCYGEEALELSLAEGAGSAEVLERIWHGCEAVGQREHEEGAQQEGEDAQHSELEEACWAQESRPEEERVDEGPGDSCQVGQAAAGVAIAEAEVAAAAIPVSEAAASSITSEAEEVLASLAGGAASVGTAEEPGAVTKMEHAGAAEIDGTAAVAVELAFATAEVAEITTSAGALADAAPPTPAVQAADVTLAVEVAAPPAAAAADAVADAGSAAHMTTDEESFTQEELDEFMELALEFSAEAMGIRAAEAMRASNGEDDALEALALALARAGPVPFPQNQTQPPALLRTEIVGGDNSPAVAATSGASRSEASAAGASDASVGSATAGKQQRRQRELQKKRQQDEQAWQFSNGPVEVRAAEGNAEAEACVALMTWDVDVGNDGTALLSPQPQRRMAEEVAAVEPGAEEAIATAGTAAEPVVYAEVVAPAAVAAATVASAAAIEPVVAVTSAPKQPSATETTPASASRNTPPPPQPGTSVAGSRPRGPEASLTFVAVAPTSPSTGGSTRGKARAKAKVVAAAFAATQAKAATAAAMAPAVASTILPAPASPTSPGGDWFTVAPSRGHRRGVVHSRQSSTSGRGDAPAPYNPSSSMDATQSMEGISSTADNGFSGSALGSAASGMAPPHARLQLRATSPVGRPQAVAAQGQRSSQLNASANPASGGGATRLLLVPAPTAAARGPINNVAAVPHSPAAHGADTASDDEDAESAARGVGWLAFGSGLLASAALVCASALHVSQNSQPRPQPAHTYLAGRASGTGGDGLKGGLLPPNMTSCPAPWLLRCVPVEVDGGVRRAAQGVPAEIARLDEDDGASGSFTEAAGTATGAMAGVDDGQLDGRQVEREEEEEHRMALAGLGAAVALVSHPQYAGSGVPAWLGSDPRVVSAELDVQLYEGVVPLMGDGESEAQWDEEVELAAAEVWEGQMETQDAWEEPAFEGPAAAGADVVERRQAEHAATTAAVETVAVEVAEAPAVPAAWPIVNTRPLGVVVPTDTVRAPAVAPAAAADSVPAVESVPLSTARYLQGAGICLAAVVTATVSALLWAGRRRRQIPRNPWMAEWKSVWDVGPIPSPWRKQHQPAGAAYGSADADNGVYDAYGAAAAAAAGAAAAYGNADPFGYSAGGAAAAPSASGSFGGLAGHAEPTEHDVGYYQQQQPHHHHNNDSPVRRATRDVAPNAGLLDCYYLRSNRLVPRGSPRSPAGREVGSAGGLFGGGGSPGSTGSGFAAGGQGAPPRTPQPQQDVWYHWLRNRTIFCFNQQEMSPEARRLMADQHH